MALTTTERSDIIKLVVGMFNVAPGSTYLSQFTVAYEANGRSLSNLAKDLAKTGAFLSINPVFQTGSEFATSFLTPLGLQANTEAVAFIVARFNAGESKGQIALEALTALNASTAPAFANAKAILNNKTAVAENYSVAQNGSATALAALQSVVATVTADAASVTAAIAVNAGVAAAGQTFSLTVGVDTIVGTAGNDTITGTFDPITSLSTLSGLDNIDGGAGTDTLTITDADTGGGNIDFTSVTIKNVEVLSVKAVANLASATLDLTTVAPGLTSATIDVAQGGPLTVTAETTTALNLTNDGNVTVVGGGGALVIKTDGNVIVGDTSAAAADANALTSVNVTQVLASGSSADITDNSGAAGAIGSKLTSVSLSGVGAASTLTGDGITTLSLTKSDVAVTVTNTKAHTLGLTVSTLAAGAEVIDATATAVNVTTTGTTATSKGSTLIIGAGKATTITVDGAGDVTLDATGADYAALTTFNYTGSGSATADLTAAALLTKVVAGTATGDIDVTVDGAVTTVTTGSGDDTVTIDGTTTTSFKGALSLGGGSDTVSVSGGGVITAAAVIDAGDGVDNLSLAIVGSVNVGAFKNFENFDVAGISADFDQAVLNANNTVANFIGTAAVGAAVTIQNMGAGVGFIVKGDMESNATFGSVTTAEVVTLTQATAGAMTITVDVDGAEGVGAIETDASFIASNATALTVEFDNQNVDAVANLAEVNLTGSKATTLAIVSGGSEVSNKVDYTGAAVSGNDLLTSVTIAGDQALEFNYTTTGGSTLKLASVDASGQTDGGLTFSLDDLTATGTVKLGGGDDVISFDTAIDTTAVTSATVLTINGVQKGAEEALGTQDGFDVLVFAGATQAADITVAATIATAGFGVKDGLATFVGAGPANLAAAIVLLDATLSDDEAVVFNFAGTNYIYGAGISAGGGTATDLTDDFLVKLTGVTDIAGLDAAGAGNIYLF